MNKIFYLIFKANLTSRCWRHICFRLSSPVKRKSACWKKETSIFRFLPEIMFSKTPSCSQARAPSQNIWSKTMFRRRSRSFPTAGFTALKKWQRVQNFRRSRPSFQSWRIKMSPWKNILKLQLNTIEEKRFLIRTPRNFLVWLTGFVIITNCICFVIKF